MIKQFHVEVTREYDPEGIESDHPDADAVARDELAVVYVAVRIVSLDTLKESYESLSGIAVNGMDDPYLNEVTDNLLTEAFANSGVKDD